MTDDQARPIDVSGGPPHETLTGPPTGPATTGMADVSPAPHPAVASAPAVPVTASGGGAGPNRVRLLAGLGTAGLILVLTAGAVLLLGAPSTPEALRYIPADAGVVAELRMDLPGDQMQKLGNLLAKFPGFADQSTLPEKLDEAFDKIVQGATNGEADYVTDVKPWLNGPLFIGVDPAAMAREANGGDGSLDGVVLAATTNGAVACDAPFEGQTTTTETHNGFQLTIGEGGRMACAIDGHFAVAGDPASVRKALDAKAAGNGIDRSDAYMQARRTLSGEQLATLWFDGNALQAAALSPMPSLPIGGLDFFASIPEWAILGVRAEDDALVIDGATGPTPAPSGGPSLLPLPAAHASSLIGLVPADTLLYIEDQGTGVSLQNLLARLRTIPELQEPLGMLDGMTDPAGLVGWVQDAAIAVSASGTDLESLTGRLTVLLAAEDAATAREKYQGLSGLLSLAGMGGQGFEVSNSTVAGHEVTTVTVSDLGGFPVPGDVPDVGELPIGDVSFSLTVVDRVLYLIVGDDIEGAISVPGGGSLADDAAFKQAAARGLQDSRTTSFVAAGRALDLAEPFLVNFIGSEWTTEVKPYVDPVQAIGAWSSSDASGTRFRTVFIAAAP
ncbi:MAG TPA: DUF3352 domain-containing protein [Candidatus Binatia bacterium]|nr:DUF3352 domain-containing protein [Candidatus Binatia bacterium]